MLKDKVKKILFFVILTLPMLLIGCFLFEPDLSEVEWVGLDVKYCVKKNGNISIESWATSDMTLLTELRAAYHQTAISGLSVAGYTKSNRVIVTTKDKGDWYLFFYAPTSARLRKVGSPKRSYSVDLSPSFYHYLNTKLTSLEEEPDFFGGRCDIWGNGITPR